MKLSNIQDIPERAAFFNLVPSQVVKLAEHPCVRIPLADGGEVVGQWSGTHKGFPVPPEIGTRVNVTMNSLGFGIVEGYFVESGFVGVMVLPERGQAPDWWTKQNAAKGRTHYTVFGYEISPVRIQAALVTP